MRRDIFDRDWRDDQPPLYYQLQIATEAMLMGASWAVIAALIMDAGGGWTPFIYEVNRNEMAEARIRAKVIQFWTDFDAGRMPSIDPKRDAETVAALYPKPLASMIDLSGDNALPLQLSERAELKATIKVASERVDAIETDLKAKMGVNERALIPGFKVTWKHEHRDAYTVAAQDRRVLRVFKEHMEDDNG